MLVLPRLTIAVIGIVTTPMSVEVLAEVRCPLGKAIYSSGNAILEFDAEAGNQITFSLGSLELGGSVSATNGYGYTIYEFSDADSDDQVFTDNLYTLTWSNNLKTITEGGWVDNDAPQAVLLSNFGGQLLRYLQDKNREKEFSVFSDVFIFKRCSV
jgi:hypothetical protein